MLSRAEWPAAAAALLLSLLMLSAATLGGSARLDLGGPSAAALRGFYRPEAMAENWLQAADTTFQWTDGAAELLTLRRPAGRALLRLTVADTRPGTQATELTVTADGVPQRFAVPRGSYRRYTLLLPAAHWAAPLRIGFSSATEPSPNGEPYGVAVFAVEAAALDGSRLPDWRLLGWSAAAGPALWLLWRLAVGLRARPALAATTAVLLIWSGLTLWQPAAYSAYLTRLSGLALLAAAAVLLTYAVYARLGGGPAGLAAGLGLSIWLMPWAHQLIVWTAWSVAPPAGWALLIAALTVPAALLLLRLARPALRTRGLLLLTAAAAAAGLVGGVSDALRDNAYDFMAHWEGLQRWLAGGRLYDLAALRHNHFAAVFKIPPFYTLLYLPLSGLDAAAALALWRGLSIGMALLSAWLLWPLLRGAGGRTALVVLLVAYQLRPLSDSIAYGQTDLLLLLLLAALLRLWRSGRSTAAGVLLGVAGLIKLYPLLLVLWWLRRRDWRALGGTVLGLIGGTLLALAVLGPAVHRSFVLQVLPLIGGTTNWIENQTVSGVVTRTAGELIKLRPFTLQPYVAIGLLLSAALVVLVAWRQQPQTERCTPQALLEFSAWTMLFALAAPAAWLHYHTLLVLPIVALAAAQQRPLTAQQISLAALGWLLTAYGNHRSFHGGPTTELLSLLGMNLRFVGMLLLLLLVLQQLRRARPAETVVG
jgi:hypothetical protein